MLLILEAVGCSFAVNRKRVSFFDQACVDNLFIKFYPLKGAEVLYAADVPIWFRPESQGYPDISQKCSFIACAATNHPVLTSDGRLSKHEIELLLRKIHLIMHVAYSKGHRNIVTRGNRVRGVWQ